MIVVAGGYDSSDYLSSTEKMAIGDLAWDITYHSLPRAIQSVSSLSMGNKVYIAGEL